MKLVILLSLLVSATNAHAIHAYGTSLCSNKKAQIRLAYDGPGSNYAVGGFYNFYVGKSAQGILANDNSIYEEKVNDIVADQKLEVTFKVSKNKKIGEVKTTKVDCSQAEGFDFEHSEWRSVKTVKIEDISKEASAKLKMKSGDSIELLCLETSDIPVSCE